MRVYVGFLFRRVLGKCFVQFLVDGALLLTLAHSLSSRFEPLDYELQE